MPPQAREPLPHPEHAPLPSGRPRRAPVTVETSLAVVLPRAPRSPVDSGQLAGAGYSLDRLAQPGRVRMQVDLRGAYRGVSE